MLILSRHVGETIMIGDDIKIEIKNIKDCRKVVVGIDAPKDVKVFRTEIYDSIKEQEEKTRKAEAEKSGK